jgi:hypothetical protein
MFLSKFASLGLAGVLVLAGLSACTPHQEGQDDPKRRLNDYISESFAVKSPQDRNQLLGYLTGDAKTRLASWSDEQFREAFMDSKRQFLKLAFKEMKPVSANEVSITYEITYQTNRTGADNKPHDTKITNKKLAQMVHQENKWLISDVRNIKELVEYKDEMSLP